MAKVICLQHWLTGCGCPYGTADNPPDNGCMHEDRPGEYCNCTRPHDEKRCDTGVTNTIDILNQMSDSDFEPDGGCCCVYVDDIRRGYFNWLPEWARCRAKYKNDKMNKRK